MTTMPRLILVVISILAGCGGSGTGSGSGAGSATGSSAGSGAGEEDPTGDSDATGSDRPTPTRGMDVGAAACDGLVGRVLRCDGIGEEEKREFRRSAEIWREEAAGGRDSRQAADQDCREMARAMEESLGRLGC